jgi:ADP-heptose:LPS heptosyltransferase
MNKVVKVLVIRFSSIGDIVLITPVLRCLKQQLPAAEVHFCTKQVHQSILKSNPYVDRFHLLEDNIFDLIHCLRAENFDYIIDLHNNVRSTVLKAALQVRSFTVNKLNWRKWFYVRFKADVMPDQHIVDRYLATISTLGIKDDGEGLDYFIASADRVDRNHLPDVHQLGYVAYAIGGQYATKRLPVSRMIELCQKIGSPVVLLGAAEDKERGEQVRKALGEGLIYNACGLYNLSQSASLLEQAIVVFSHDTGLMHIAAALQKEVYSIWGSTTPQFGMYPYKTRYTVLEKKGLGCRPCSKIGFNQCPAGHFRCMNELPFTFDKNDIKRADSVILLPIAQ